MAVLQQCPSCGMKSSEVRCPRCNALKAMECSGSCTLCGVKGGCDVPEPERPAEKPAAPAGAEGLGSK